MVALNKVILVGNLGKDPEIRHFEGGSAVAHFSLATTEAYKDKLGQRIEQTEWHKITAWGKTAELIEKFVVKGKEIAIEGKLSHRSYDDKDGNKRYITEVIANEVLFLSK